MRRELVIGACVLVAAIVVAFAPLFNAGITNWDDSVYLRLASAPLSQLVTAPAFGNYHPLTMLSFAVEERLFGIHPAELHAVNLLLHLCGSILIFLFLFELSGSTLGALAGALFFAIHPLRVESVGWIAERKDVLCELFFAAALLAYARHVRRGAHFGWTVAWFVLAVLAKATAVVFPVAVLLIDFLERRRPRAVRTAALFAISVAFGILAVAAQRGSGALAKLPVFAFTPLQKALLSGRVVAMYIAREIVPVNLSAFYPYPRAVGAADVAATVAVLALAVALAAAAFRWRAAVFGAAFFLLTVAPTLPLLSVGWTLAADRFTLLPSIGLAYLVTIGVMRIRSAMPVVIAGSILLAFLTWQRCAAWHDSVALWTSVIEYDDTIAFAYNSRAVALVAEDAPAAKRDLDRAVLLDPCYGSALRNRALFAGRAGDLAAADRDLQRAMACDPSDEQARQMRRSLPGPAGSH
jgi:tetratricopeptide (TPR) repeat protein